MDWVVKGERTVPENQTETAYLTVYVNSSGGPQYTMDHGNENKEKLATHLAVKPFGFEIYPNPAQEKMSIQVYQPGNGFLSISILDGNGRKTRTIFSGIMQKGNNRLEVSLQGLPVGVYHCQVQAGNKIYTQKLMLQ
jgi:hypothetical protein